MSRSTGRNGNDAMDLSYSSSRSLSDQYEQTSRENKQILEKLMKNSEDHHQYINISIPNTSITNTKPAQFTQTFNSPLVQNPSDYHLAVMRFLVPLQEVPLFVFEENIYSVTMSSQDTSDPTQIYYTPQTFLIFQSSNIFPFSTPYIRNYQQFINMVNTALLSAYTNLVAALGGGALPNPSGTLPPYAPYLYLDPVTSLISIYAPYTAANQGYAPFQPVSTGGVKIYFNTQLFNIFQSFTNIYNGDGVINPVINGSNQWIQIYTTGNNDAVIGSAGGPTSQPATTKVLKVTQQYPTLYNWLDFKTLVFATSQIPIRAEFAPTFNSSGILNPSTGTQPILTDFQPVFTSQADGRNYLQYFPQSEFRLIDLTSSNPLNTLSINIYWADFLGNLFPLLIPPSDSVSIKLMLRRKSSLN